MNKIQPCIEWCGIIGARAKVGIMIHQTSTSWTIRFHGLHMLTAIVGFALLISGGTGCGQSKEHTDALRRHSESLDGMDADKVRQLINDGADVNVRNRYNATPLYMAAGMNQRDTVKFLLAAKADVEAAPLVRTTPLYVAAGNGHTEIVKLLLAAGASVNPRAAGKPKPGNAPSPRFDSPPFIPHVPEPYRDTTVHRAERDPLWMASSHGHSDIVKLLLEAGADVNVTNRNRMTALYMAVLGNHADVVEVLAAHQADVNMADRAVGYTPLYLASKRGQVEIAKLLLQAGADVNAVAKDGSAHPTPMGIAKYRRYTEVVELLTKHGGGE